MMTLTAASVHARIPAEAGEGSAGGTPWLMIAVGLLIGIGIGVLIVVRAKRANPMPGNRPGGGAAKGRSDRE
ncbi:hypothetical protein Acsp03_16500 [Actinomadura sp. NBRC 104412]|uniref:hypothetical protein n=1 Tax=Actinomadura sp. NBRC 104412 TaxID=3032203 RepID=UPI0024A0216E|nr:hypothetical protein [Actinomadura sp. NBRC 104412]GLZ04184.1 hypothetical protein Acsp03_16500 [Actinomadura sp. NBRC 104412]